MTDTLSIDGIRDAANARADRRSALFPGKRPGLEYLTPWAKDRLKSLASNAGVSHADFLEVLIRRYGIRAGSDILTALGEEHDPTLDQPGS